MFNLEKETALSLKRILPDIEMILTDDQDRTIFCERLNVQFPAIFRLLYHLYGQRYDFFYHLQQTVNTAARLYHERAVDLKELDQRREIDPLWFQSEQMMGAVGYVDLFAGNLDGVRSKIPYFKELGLTYLHLMPLFRCPPKNNDGGYAISSFREVNPDLGTVDQLKDLAQELRTNGISLVLDFVFNHTSDEHEWAQRALAGDEDYQNFYYLFEDRRQPDLYERHLREIFPDQAPGNFTFRPEIQKWVWTTFNTFQWDLNYANPAVFTAMLDEMLTIANMGAEVLRLDAVAFIWKQLGTSCESLPQVHLIIQAYNALVRIAAPAMIFKSEAIVHPSDIASYVHPEESPLSYNPTMMALLWESLATRKITLLRRSMNHWFDLPEGCSWVNYVRCHDDIGWSFADEDAAEVGINGFDHRQFLNAFYTGDFPGSYARGVPFNYNPITKDMRISGMGASLAGLEIDDARDMALRRIELIHSIIISAGGIPLIYLGDEIATLNDPSYRGNPFKAEDSRWIHRPAFDWGRAERRHDVRTNEGRIFQTIQRLIQLRQQNPALANGTTEFFDTGNEHVLGYVRNGQMLMLANFSETEQTLRWTMHPTTDLISGSTFGGVGHVTLQPYQFIWLRR
jgi:glycosidase